MGDAARFIRLTFKARRASLAPVVELVRSMARQAVMPPLPSLPQTRRL